jgi:hypothetical protein
MGRRTGHDDGAQHGTADISIQRKGRRHGPADRAEKVLHHLLHAHKIEELGIFVVMFGALIERAMYRLISK